MGDDIKITVIATGFRDAQPQRRERMLGGVADAESASGPESVYQPRIAPRVANAPFASEVAPSRPATSYAANTNYESAPVRVARPSAESEGAGKAIEEQKAPAGEGSGDALNAPPAAARMTPEESPTVGTEAIGVASAQGTAPVERAGGASAMRPPTAAGAYHPIAANESKAELVPVPASVFDDEFFQKGNEELRASQRPWASEATGSPASGIAPDAAGAQKWPEVRVPSFAGYAGETNGSSPEGNELDIPAFLRRNH